MDKISKHFVLVHGACLGAWSWYKVATLLKSDGHKVTCVDLAGSSVNPKQRDEIKSMSDYMEPLMGFMESVSEDDHVVIVAHSAGGFSVSVAMEKFPLKTAVAVFVSAIMPSPDYNILAVNQEDLTLAELLVRPYPLFADDVKLVKETKLTKENYRMVPRVFILLKDYCTAKENLQRWMIEINPPEEVKVITGSDHMVMCSKPQQLHCYLQEIADKYH